MDFREFRKIKILQDEKMFFFRNFFYVLSPDQ